ncbi:hypothetical protein AVEN_100083-1 [Araneus ventricosus]|uniref:Uncharacterized protein n=1 Tax=Araneus ventricosus TaxID=182803 RepID=A0A4Y2VVR3_ARAVE|nr:hypothetical protein AVEN_100083-1 [Araneus ventricosus]
MADYGVTDDHTLLTLTGTRDALRASCRSLNEYYEPEVEEKIHKMNKEPRKADVVWRLGESVQTHVWSSSSDHGSK